jgi:rod shape determining protein RodA
MPWAIWLRKLPWSIVALWLALVLVGWMGIARSAELAGYGGWLLVKQMLWSIVALALMLAATVPNYRALGRVSYLLFGGVLLLLVAVYFFPPVNGSRRWIRCAGLTFQPAELAKLAYVLLLARYLMDRENFRRLAGLFAPLALTIPPVLLILREPDLGTAAVFLPLLMLMLVVAGARRRDLGLVLAAGVLLLPVLWTQMSREQRSRVTATLQQKPVNATPHADGYHLHQAKLVLALGGVWGSYWTGEVSEDASAYRVPEGATDSIFVILGERFGIVGVMLLLGLYVALVWRALLLAERTREPFGRLVAAGIAALFGIQAIINTGMLVGLLPITGLSLPLVSYGGSGLVVHSLALGILLNIGLRPGYEVGSEPFVWRE